jgi:hypothetical protein
MVFWDVMLCLWVGANLLNNFWCRKIQQGLVRVWGQLYSIKGMYKCLYGAWVSVVVKALRY